MPKATAHVLNVMAGVSPRPTLETYLPAMLRKGLVHHWWIDPHIPYMNGQYFTNLENHQTKVNHGESIRIYFLKWAFWWVTRQLQDTSRCSWSISPSNILHQSFQAAKPLTPSLRMQMLILPTLDHTPSEIEWQMTIRSKLGGLNKFFRWRHDTHLTRNKHWRWYCIHLCFFFGVIFAKFAGEWCISDRIDAVLALAPSKNKHFQQSEKAGDCLGYLACPLTTQKTFCDCWSILSPSHWRVFAILLGLPF